jgi:hypothetical protein
VAEKPRSALGRESAGKYNDEVETDISRAIAVADTEKTDTEKTLIEF